METITIVYPGTSELITEEQQYVIEIVLAKGKIMLRTKPNKEQGDEIQKGIDVGNKP